MGFREGVGGRRHAQVGPSSEHSGQIWIGDWPTKRVFGSCWGTWVDGGVFKGRPVWGIGVWRGGRRGLGGRVVERELGGGKGWELFGTSTQHPVEGQKLQRGDFKKFDHLMFDLFGRSNFFLCKCVFSILPHTLQHFHPKRKKFDHLVFDLFGRSNFFGAGFPFQQRPRGCE